MKQEDEVKLKQRRRICYGTIRYGTVRNVLQPQHRHYIDIAVHTEQQPVQLKSQPQNASQCVKFPNSMETTSKKQYSRTAQLLLKFNWPLSHQPLTGYKSQQDRQTAANGHLPSSSVCSTMSNSTCSICRS